MFMMVSVDYNLVATFRVINIECSRKPWLMEISRLCSNIQFKTNSQNGRWVLMSRSTQKISGKYGHCISSNFDEMHRLFFFFFCDITLLQVFSSQNSLSRWSLTTYEQLRTNRSKVTWSLHSSNFDWIRHKILRFIVECSDGGRGCVWYVALFAQTVAHVKIKRTCGICNDIKHKQWFINN